jgi:hypothetical protein
LQAQHQLLEGQRILRGRQEDFLTRAHTAGLKPLFLLATYTRA